MVFHAPCSGYIPDSLIVWCKVEYNTNSVALQSMKTSDKHEIEECYYIIMLIFNGENACIIIN